MISAQSSTARIATMMLVDDNDFDQVMYKRIIGRSGLVDTLLQFLSAREALDYLQNGTHPLPDVVLLDINMPGMNGFDFLLEATDSLGARMCPVVIMLTTSLNPADEAQASSFDIVKGFYTKPLANDMLETILQTLPLE
ncbi:MAG: response regulator [Paracoccaceae bacterium]